MISFRAKALKCGLELRSEVTVNGAAAGAQVSTPTEVAALIVEFDPKSQPFVLISCDVIWFPSGMAKSLRQAIAAMAGTSEAHVCLAASHTHGTPNPERNFQFPEWSIDLEEHISDKVLEVVQKTLEQPRTRATLNWGRGRLQGFAINRRRRALALRPRLAYRTQSLPNAKGTSDDTVDVMVLADSEDQRPLALVCRYTCHPVADSANQRGADYPGYFREAIRSQLQADLPILFVQGFCGDIRPNLQVRPLSLRDRLIQHVVGPRFRRSRAGDAQSIGQALANIIAQLFNDSQLQPLHSDQQSAELHTVNIDLDDNTQTNNRLELTVWDWSTVKLLFASGEMLSGLLPSRTNSCLCIGYANGMVGYVPSEADLKYGGYEIDSSRQNFQLPARISPASCRRIEGLIESLAR
ncbi:MAG: hypothetical protein AAF346_01620 [Pseudomonadota bacterium]